MIEEGFSYEAAQIASRAAWPFKTAAANGGTRLKVRAVPRATV